MIHLIRTDYSDKYIMGYLLVIRNDEIVFTARTLERPYLDNRKNVSAVMSGTYTIVEEYSPAFKENLFELKGTPDRSEIKIHVANFPHELMGCIAIGDYSGPGVLKNSRDKLEAFHDAMDGVKRTTITIHGMA